MYVENRTLTFWTSKKILMFIDFDYKFISIQNLKNQTIH